MKNLITLVIYAGLLLGANAACADGGIDGAEECDGGIGCSGSCTCSLNFVPSNPISVNCDDVCPNPITPLSSNIVSSVTATMDPATFAVTFHALVKHQSATISGNEVDKTSILFGSVGTPCDYPLNGVLALGNLVPGVCNDDYSFTDKSFSSLIPCLSMTCVNSVGGTVDCLDPTDCASPPCTKVFSQSVKVSREYTVFSGNGAEFNVLSEATHPIDFEFPWVQGTTFNSIVWATPDIAGSAVITSVVYDPVSTQWDIKVSTSLNWPYQLRTDETTLDFKINGNDYVVSECALPLPEDGVPCIQTITFSVNGCNGIHSTFAGVAKLFGDLKYQCFDEDSMDCPLEAGVANAAPLSIFLDTVDSPCELIDNDITIVEADLTFQMKQTGFLVDRTSFLLGDTLAFTLAIDNGAIPATSIDSISVVSFRETKEHSGTDFTTTKVVSAPCTSTAILCFTFDSADLTAIDADNARTDLEFVVIVQIDFNGVSKKRMTLDLSNFQMSLSSTVEQPDEEPSVSTMPVIMPLLALVPFVLGVLFF